MGHLSFYNKNQIRDKLLLVLIFAAGEVIEWQGYGIGSEREYTYSRRYGWMKKINRKFLRLIFQLILSVFFCYSSSFQFTSSRETTNAASLYSKCSTGCDFSGLV